MPARATRHVSRIAYLDGIRGVAVLLVVFYHASTWHLRLPFQVRGGYIGVDVFFVLSGYVITSILIRRDLTIPPLAGYSRFMRARVRRLYPALLAMLAGVCVTVWLGWTPVAGQPARHVTLLTLLAAAQLTSFWSALHISSMNVVGSTWTLSIEWIFYSVWPFLVWWLRGQSRAWRSAAALAVIVYAASFAIPADVWWVLPPGRIAQLLAGASLALYLSVSSESQRSQASRIPGHWHVGTALGLAAILAWSFVITPGPAYYGFRQTGAPIVTIGALALIHGGARPGWVHSLLATRPLAAVGRVSYSLYLVHLPLMYAFGTPLGDTKSWLVTLSATVAITAATVSSFVLFERPHLRRNPHGTSLLGVIR